MVVVKYFIIKRILLPLLLLSLVATAADEYAGAQLPIVFAGPQTFTHNGKLDAHDLVDRRFLPHNYAGKLDADRVYPIYDAGSPKLVTSILIQGSTDPEFYNTSRVGSFLVYGSNDKTEWTLFWEGHSLSINTHEFIRLVRDPATGTCSAWTLVAPSVGSMPVMSTATLKGDYDDSSYPCSTRYRYYRIEASPKADFHTVNAGEFSLWTPDLCVFAKRPIIATSLSAFDSPDDLEGVSFRGTLTYAPAGTADILVAIARQDYGADLAAWRASGAQVETIATGLASGADFSAKVGLGKGIWHTRTFAVSGADVTASPVTFRAVVGTAAEYPAAHYSGWNDDKCLKMYNGNLDDWGDVQSGDSAVFVFDCTGMSDRYPAALRIWTRVGSLDIEKIRGRTAVVSVTSDQIEWPAGETVQSETPRKVYNDISANTQASANWTIVEDLSWTQMDWMDCCYDVVLPENLARTAKYLKVTNVSMAHAREFEVRTLKKGGLIMLVR